MLTRLGFFSIFPLFVACSAPREQVAPIRDFFIAPADSHWFANLEAAPPTTDSDACRARIASLLCLVDPEAPPAEGEERKPRECLAGTDLSPAARSLEAIYDAEPTILRTIFCGLGRIYVERDFMGSAYAGTDPTGTQAIMGIRASLLLESPVKPMRDWISWKEQLSFGGDPKNYETRPDLVHVDASMNLGPETSDLLFYIIAHEFGHLIDFKYGANAFDCAQPSPPPAPADGSTDDRVCQAHPGSWSALSWKEATPDRAYAPDDPWGLRNWIPNESGSFEHREELCFYACPAGHGRPELMKPMYDSLQRSTFLTSYSATNSYDDFAESMAFYAGTGKADMSYAVRLPDGTIYDLAAKFRSDPLFAVKREWLVRFIEGIESGATRAREIKITRFRDRSAIQP